MTEEQQMDAMIDELYDNYVLGGFDFNTDQSLDDIFRMIFKDAALTVISLYEGDEEESDEEE